MTEQGQATQNQAQTSDAAQASELFAELVLRQAQLALVLMGKMPHPESGKAQCDLDQARIAIDLLKMLELKTKGNLTKDEDALLKQSLIMLQMAFVEAVESAPKQANQPAYGGAAGDESPASRARSAGTESAQADEQSRKRFVKKY